MKGGNKLADVSVEALQKVKSALNIFQSDITGISSRATAQAQNCLGGCHQKVSETQAKINELDSEITNLNNIISDLESQISASLNQIQQLESSIPRMEKQLQDIGNNINNLQQQLSALQAQLADAEDDGTRQQIQAQINMVTQQLNSLYRKQSELQYQIQNSKKQKETLQQKISELKSKKARCGENLSIAKKRKVLYVDCELSDWQFKERYSEEDAFFVFQENFYRAKIDILKAGELADDALVNNIKDAAIAIDAKVIIIDNLSWLCMSSEKASDAIKLMRRLIGLRDGYKFSILVISHTPKNAVDNGINDNSLVGH